MPRSCTSYKSLTVRCIVGRPTSICAAGAGSRCLFFPWLSCLCSLGLLDRLLPATLATFAARVRAKSSSLICSLSADFDEFCAVESRTALFRDGMLFCAIGVSQSLLASVWLLVPALLLLPLSCAVVFCRLCTVSTLLETHADTPLRCPVPLGPTPVRSHARHAQHHTVQFR